MAGCLIKVLSRICTLCLIHSVAIRHCIYDKRQLHNYFDFGCVLQILGCTATKFVREVSGAIASSGSQKERHYEQRAPYGLAFRWTALLARHVWPLVSRAGSCTRNLPAHMLAAVMSVSICRSRLKPDICHRDSASQKAVLAHVGQLMKNLNSLP